VLDAGNGNFWVYYGGMTDLEYSITVRDVPNNRSEQYHKAAGNLCGGADTSFGTAAGNSPPGAPLQVSAAGVGPPNQTCTASAETLCLRPSPPSGYDTVPIKVQATWKVSEQWQGVATGGPLPNTAQGGYFTFFSPTNVELLTKVLDARSVNDHFWIFTGGLSNVEYRLTLTNVINGRWVQLHNPPGNLCGSVVLNQLY
jgi:hypothetical protein